MSPSAVGWVPLDVALAVGAALAAVLQLAVLRSPDVPELSLVEASRRVRAAGWSLLALHCGWVLVADGDLPIDYHALVPLLLLAWADVAAALVRLYTGQGALDEAAGCRPGRRA